MLSHSSCWVCPSTSWKKCLTTENPSGITLVQSTSSDFICPVCSRVCAACTACLEKRSKHYWLALKEWISNFNNFWYKYSWHNWPLNDCLVFYLTKCLHYTSWEKENQWNTSWNEPKYIKTHPQHYWLWLEEGLTDFNNFWYKHFDTTYHQVTVLVPTSLNVCFCFTWEKPNSLNTLKMQYYVGCVFSGNAVADNGCSGKSERVWWPVVSEISV